VHPKEETMTKPILPPELDRRLEEARLGARALRASSTETRNRVLAVLEGKLVSKEAELLAANRKDLDALAKDATAAFRDRLALDSKRLAGMRESLRQVGAFPDPVGEVVESSTLANGLRTRRVRTPLGVILMIFESRPNVAIEAFSLALKSGNAILLRGGKESRETVTVLYRLIEESISDAGLPAGAFIGISNPDREIVKALLADKERIDVVVPRGGEGLISFVVENARMPIIKNDRGLCHIYVHEDADLVSAARIVENAKTQRPGVCNAMETLLVHQKVAGALAGELAKIPAMVKVEFRVAANAKAEFEKAFPGRVRDAEASDFDTEYLDLILNVKVVDGIEDAITHIERHGSRHSESILTKTEALARRFQNEVDAAAVYWNASTRFTDGFALGLGGELGISTQKLHVRGPVGLRELTSVRWIIDGEGQIR
jgi:glutamate-5-semialdehyde dehydrogenase